MSTKRITTGSRLTTSPTYRGSSKLKATNVPIDWTPDLMLEYQKCMQDPVHFIREHMTIVNLDRGVIKFDLYPYQEQMVENFEANRMNIVLACRQSGKSISVLAYILWYAIFHANKNIGILANKGETARELLSRLQMAYENLPFFLQVGVKFWNKGSMELGNGTTIYARATHADTVRGMSLNLILLDEFAFIEDAEAFYTSTYPTISSGKTTKIIITSTANGVGNPFHRLWKAANDGSSQYAPFRVDWWDVPGRDEAWKNQTIADTSELQFEQEFGNSFVATGDTLISTEALLGMNAVKPIDQLTNFRQYKRPEPGRVYCLCADVARGCGMDYSAFSIIDITEYPYEQVATFYDNETSPILFGTIINRYGTLYNDAMVLIENNDQGIIVCHDLYYDIEYENLFVESSIKSSGIGIAMNKKTKKIGCSVVKDLIESRNLLLWDENTINEFMTFSSKNEVGTTFEATKGNHDDLVMSLVVFSYFTTLPDFQNYHEKKMKTSIFKDRISQFEDEVMPIFVNSGREDQYIVDTEGQRWEVVES